MLAWIRLDPSPPVPPLTWSKFFDLNGRFRNIFLGPNCSEADDDDGEADDDEGEKEDDEFAKLHDVSGTASHWLGYYRAFDPETPPIDFTLSDLFGKHAVDVGSQDGMSTAILARLNEKALKKGKVYGTDDDPK